MLGNYEIIMLEKTAKTFKKGFQSLFLTFLKRLVGLQLLFCVVLQSQIKFKQYLKNVVLGFWILMLNLMRFLFSRKSFLFVLYLILDIYFF